MNPPHDVKVRLFRMEQARRQIQHQLDLIDRQIVRRMAATIPSLQPKRTVYRRGRASESRAFLERYRGNLAALTAERQQEIDALSRKLARQDRAIAALRERLVDRKHSTVSLLAMSPDAERLAHGSLHQAAGGGKDAVERAATAPFSAGTSSNAND